VLNRACFKAYFSDPALLFFHLLCPEELGR
jgi:hypothetical protein